MKKKIAVVMGFMALSLFGGALTTYGAVETKAVQAGNIVTYQSDTVRTLGNWEQQIDGFWKFKKADGTFLISSWCESLTEPGVYYFLNSTGVMAVSTYTPDGYYVVSDGSWKNEAALEEYKKREPNQADYVYAEDYYRDMANWLLEDPEDQRISDELMVAEKDVTLN